MDYDAGPTSMRIRVNTATIFEYQQIILAAPYMDLSKKTGVIISGGIYNSAIQISGIELEIDAIHSS